MVGNIAGHVANLTRMSDLLQDPCSTLEHDLAVVGAQPLSTTFARFADILQCLAVARQLELAHARSEVTYHSSFIERQKRIRHQRADQYLTQAARVAKAPSGLASLDPKLAIPTLDFGNPTHQKWQP